MLGQQIQARRQAMQMSLNVLSRELGGSPGPSFLSKIESGVVDPTPAVTRRLAQALHLPQDLLLNAAGYATEVQRFEAMNKVRDLIGDAAPLVVSLPVLDAANPDVPLEALPIRQRLMRRKEDAFIIELSGPGNAPYVGEAIVSRDRVPREGQGVVARVGDTLSAWTYHDPGKPYLENGHGERREKNYEVLGVILRVVSEIDLES